MNFVDQKKELKVKDEDDTVSSHFRTAAESEVCTYLLIIREKGDEANLTFFCVLYLQLNS